MPYIRINDFIRNYFETYSGVKLYLDSLREAARRDGFASSPSGRRRVLTDLRSSNRVLRQAAERMAINFPVQSFAADIIKLAMVEIDRELNRRGAQGRMIMQVHDELVFEVPQAELQSLLSFAPKAMVEAYPLSVPLVVDCAVGPNWAELERVASA